MAHDGLLPPYSLGPKALPRQGRYRTKWQWPVSGMCH